MIIKKLSVVLMLNMTVLLSNSAMAHGGSHFGGGHSGGFGGFHGGGHFGAGHFGGFHHQGFGGFGFYSAFPFYWPSYTTWPYNLNPYYYSYPSVVTPSTPPVYIEQGSVPKFQALETNRWDYCSKPEGYYPHVKSCPSGWQSLSPQPTGQKPGYWYYCNNPNGYYPYVRICSTNWQKVVP